MAGIDPMYHLANTILHDKEIVIFLGAGASMEGTQEGKRFAGFGELIDNILKDWGFDPTKRKKRTENFLEVIQRWENEGNLAAKLHEYLEGEPGLAHYHLVALSIAFYGESNALLYLTTNYDDLLERAFKDLERNTIRKFNTKVFSLRPNIFGSEFQKMVKNMDTHIKSGRPVILKLFGDLNSQSPIFRQEDMKFELGVEGKLREWMRKPMIFIGYSFSDKIIQQLLIASMGSSPVFLVTPSGKKVPTHIKELKRVHHIKKRFSAFIIDLFKIFKQRNPSIIEKTDKIINSIGLMPEFLPQPVTTDEKKPSDTTADSSESKPKTGEINEETQSPMNPVKKILILSANPKFTPQLRFDEEIREIQKSLWNATSQRQFEIKVILSVRLKDLRRMLLDYKPHIVHFTGHGDKEGLLVEDELGMPVRISSKALSNLFKLSLARTECVILSTSYSASLANDINKYINYVIGMRRGIEDKAAIEFAVGFYDALGAAKSVEEAFKFGCNAILQMFPNLSEHLIPVLKKRKDLEKQDSIEIRAKISITEMNRNTLEKSSKKILILSVNPKTTSRLRFDEEIREIEDVLWHTKHQVQFEIKARLAIRLRDLRRALLKFEPHIVHFTGHGDKEGLLVEDELGMPVRISSKALSRLFELFSNKVECVILSTCYSALQANAISKYINYVIGMRREIMDEAAIEFTVGFYDALGAAKSVEEAFKFGCNAVLQKFTDLPEHLIPILKKRKNLEKQVSNKTRGQTEKCKSEMDGNELKQSSAEYLEDELENAVVRGVYSSDEKKYLQKIIPVSSERKACLKKESNDSLDHNKKKKKSHIQFKQPQYHMNTVKKILILSANPKFTPPFRLDEIREIEEGLMRAKLRNKFNIQSRLAVRLRDLRSALLDYKPQIVHFIGHGKREGLLVEDKLGMPVLISTKALSGLFELFSTQVECVILSACYSAPQANAISKHINYVIGMRREITDKALIEFTVGFYDALGAAKSVEEAFKYGCKAIQQIYPDLSEHLIPILKKKN